MAMQDEDHGSLTSSASDTHSSDSDSDCAETMPKVAGAAGVRIDRKAGVKDDKDGAIPKKEKRRKAKRACRPCQVAHLTCSQ